VPHRRIREPGTGTVLSDHFPQFPTEIDGLDIHFIHVANCHATMTLKVVSINQRARTRLSMCRFAAVSTKAVFRMNSQVEGDFKFVGPVREMDSGSDAMSTDGHSGSWEVDR
jgi:hypothetical protein